MSVLKAYSNNVNNIFQLMGNNENDITKSICWVLYKCPTFLHETIAFLSSDTIKCDDATISYQTYENANGITDIEITDRKNFHIIIEAKRGWNLPGVNQLSKYACRKEFVKSKVPYKAIVSMSECTELYANSYLEIPRVCIDNAIEVKHLSWKKLNYIAEDAKKGSNNLQKEILREFKIYLGGLMTMQNVNSNWVYVVSLSTRKPENCDLSYIEIVEKKNKYFCPMGTNWLKEPVNYIAFRYNGKLQSIHHVEKYVVTDNLHNEIDEMPSVKLDTPHFVFELGQTIKPSHDVRTGNLYRSQRVWAMLDTLLTSDTISEARDISKERAKEIE